jgi:hypothetical protein
VPILDPANVAAQKSSALFDVTLREFLFFAKFAESISYDHGGGIIALDRLEGKQGVSRA